LAPSVAAAVSAPAGSVLEATRSALIAAGALSTPMGQASLVLASCIDDQQRAVGGAHAGCEAAAGGVVVGGVAEQAAPADPNDEFTRKRLAREHGA
jgi:hypothetical protein